LKEIAMLSLSRLLRILVAGSLPLALPACMSFPDTPPRQNELFQAAREVIAERYPMSATSEKAGYLIAMSPVRMDGTWKTRKQISVLLVRNYTGAHDPVVRVWTLVDRGEPTIPNDPEAPGYSYTITDARPFAKNEWTPLVNLPHEEQEIYDAIIAKLGPSSPPTDRPGPPPAPQGDQVPPPVAPPADEA
jgi:hypothetical protein